MKKYLTLLLALLMVFSLWACEGQDDEDDWDDDAVAESTLRSGEDPSGEDIPAQTEQPVQTEPSVPEQTVPETQPAVPSQPEQDMPYMDQLAARYWADEEGGYHIREIKDENGQSRLCCIDSRGYITATVDPAEKVLSGVYQGVYVTATDTCVRIRSAKNGALIFEGATDENTKAYLFDEPFYDGYVLYMVHKAEAYNGVHYEIGFVDSQGRWVQEMNADAKLFSYIVDGGSFAYFEDLRYCGSDMLIFYCEDIDCRLYNIKNNTVLEYHLPEECNFWLRNYKDELLFTNGKSQPLYFFDQYAVLSDDGSYTLIANDVDNKIFVSVFGEFDGTWFDAANDTIYYLRARNDSNYEESVLYIADNTGRIIRQYDQVCVNTGGTEGFLHNGTAPLLITNQEGTKYYTVVDATGAFLFEPQKTTYYRVLDAATGTVLYNGDATGNSLAVYGSDGTILFELPGDIRIGAADMRNGVLRYEQKSQEYFADPTAAQQ